MTDPLTASERKVFEARLVEAWRLEYAKALSSRAFDARKFGRPGDCTVAKAALQRVFKEVLLVPGVFEAIRNY